MSKSSDLPLRTTIDLDDDVLEYHSHLSIFNNLGILTRKDSVSNEDIHDKYDMRRMGKTQQVRRVFRSWSLLSFNCVCTSTWEFLMLGLNTGLIAGGRAGLFWSYIITMICFTFVSASIAEMSSMIPTAGGQYHWVSEFAPGWCQKPLSYVTAWLLCLNWQAYNAYGNLLTGTMIELLIQVYKPDWQFIPWRSLLLVFPGIFVVNLVNICGSKHLPALQNMTMVVHIVGCVLCIVTVWVTAPHIEAHDVVLDWNNGSGYSSMFLVMMIGQNTANTSLASIDAAAHMAEEVLDAGITVPRAIMNTLWINGTMAFFVLVTILFSLPDIDLATRDSSDFPFFAVMRTAWPDVALQYMLWFLAAILFLGNIPFAGSAARLAFALARDGALPFPKVFTKIHPKLRVPVNTILLTMGISAILAFVNLGSSTALTAVISLAAVAQMACFGISIGCLLWRRLAAPETLPPARWSLGRYGTPINLVAVVYSFAVVFFNLWPQSLPVTLSNFNYAGPVSATVILICVLTYLTYGRRVYASPVELVRKI